MQIIRHTAEFPPHFRGGVIALGNFDGVHPGHLAVISSAIKTARAVNAPVGIVTFEPHPRTIFRPDEPPFRLTPMRAKLELLQSLGLDFALMLKFDRALAAISAESFVGETLVGTLAIRSAVVGENFRFGKARAGDGALLKELGAGLGFGVTIVPPAINADGTAYSSTAIREALHAGNPRKATLLMGRNFAIEGHVKSGDRRGRELGYPTANLTLDDYVVPKPGVYATRARLGDRLYPAVSNLGIRPMFVSPQILLETYIFDFADDIYGQLLSVELVEYLREEANFAAIPELKAQMAADCVAAKRILAH